MLQDLGSGYHKLLICLQINTPRIFQFAG